MKSAPQLVDCDCGAQMKARNIGSHLLSKKHADALAERNAHRPGIKKGGRGWSVRPKYNPDHRESDRRRKEQAILAAQFKMQEATAAYRQSVVTAYEEGYLTADDLAELCDVHKATIYDWRRQVRE